MPNEVPVQIGSPIECQEQVPLALRRAHLTRVEVDEAERCLSETAALRGRAAARKAADALTLEAAVQRAAAQRRDRASETAEQPLRSDVRRAYAGATRRSAATMMA